MIEKTVMGRLVRNVRIIEGLDAAAYLREMAGVDGETVFWAGDTYYQPSYSLTLVGDTYDAESVESFDAELEVSFEAEGSLYQLLSGFDEFVIVDFSQKGSFPSTATVYVRTDEVFSDGEEVALYSCDEETKTFVQEDAEVVVSGGYASFSADEGKTFVVSTHDLSTEAARAVTTAVGDNEAGETATTLFTGVVIVAVIAALALCCAAAALVRRRSRGARDRGQQ